MEQKIYQYDLNYNFIKEWNNIEEIIENIHGIKYMHINRCLIGRTKSGADYRWSYTPLEKPENTFLIYQYDMEYNLIKEWKSIKEITDAIPETKYGLICKCLGNKHKNEYCDYKWSRNKLEKPKPKYIYQYNQESFELIKIWESKEDIFIDSTFIRQNINRCLKKNKTNMNNYTAHNYIWSYYSNVKPYIKHSELLIEEKNYLDRHDYNYKDIDTEYWKDIDGYEDDYKISNFGNVYSKHYNRLFKLVKVGGYYTIGLRKDNKQCTTRINILVATHFVLKKDPNYNVVNHIDENKLNNHYTNLEWTTLQGNSIAYHQNKKKRTVARVIIQYDLNDNIIKEWKSIDDILEENKTFNKKYLLGVLICQNKLYNYRWEIRNDKIFQYSLENVFIKEWNTIEEIIEKNPTYRYKQLLRILYSHIAYGYKWKYKNPVRIKVIDKKLETDEEFRSLGIINGKDFSLYQISNYGTVKKQNIFISPATDMSGYKFVSLKPKETGEKKVNFKIHRLVALLWIPNSNQDIDILVNHIDENKQNNYYKNLEWVTFTKNATHSFGIKIHKLDKDTNEIIETYNSIIEAAQSCGRNNQTCISKVCKGTGITAYGYKWSYAV